MKAKNLSVSGAASLSNAAAELDEPIRRQEFLAAIEAIGQTTHVPVSVSNAFSLSLSIESGTQHLTGTVRRKTTNLASGEGMILETVDGLVVKLGTDEHSAARGSDLAALAAALSGKAEADATWQISDIVGLQDALDEGGFNAFWLTPVNTTGDLPLNDEDPIDAIRIVRSDGSIYRHITNVGPLNVQWEKILAGAGEKFAELVGDSSETVIDIPHDLGTEDVHVTVRYSGGTKEKIDVAWRVIDANTVRLTFPTPPDLESMRVIIS